MDRDAGTIFDGKYELLSFSGQGGFGVVYKAKQLQLERIVAVKILKSIATNDPDNVRRFVREAKAASELRHPNIAAVYAFGVAPEGDAYLVMEFLEGMRLSDVLAANGPMPLGRALAITAQICAALGCAHERSIIHRDIKPGNVMLVQGPDGLEQAKVVDFGSAKFLAQQDAKSQEMTRPGELIGTAEYMSPEQCAGGSVDTRSDVYSIGKVLCELVSLEGRLPADVVPIVERALHEYPNKRYASAVQMLADVEQVAQRHKQPDGATMKLVSAPLMVARKSVPIRAYALAAAGTLLLLGSSLILFSDEVSRLAVEPILSYLDSTAFGADRNTEDMLGSLATQLAPYKRGTAEALNMARLGRVERREGKSLRWIETATDIFALRRLAGGTLQHDPLYQSAELTMASKVSRLLIDHDAEKALVMTNAWLKMRQAALASNDVLIPETYCVIAEAQLQLGNVKAAEDLYVRYVKAAKRDIGPGNPLHRAKALNVLTDFAIRRNELADAESRLDSAASTCISAGEINQEICTGLNANLLLLMSRVKPEKAVALGTAWRTTIDALYTLKSAPIKGLAAEKCMIDIGLSHAFARSKQGAKALDCLEAATQACEERHELRPAISRNLQNAYTWVFARLLEAHDQPNLARFHSLLQQCSQSENPHFRQIAAICEVDWSRSLSSHNDVIKAADKALALLARSDREVTGEKAGVLTKKAEALRELKRYAESEAVYLSALEFLPENARDVAEINAHLGFLYYVQNRVQDALPKYQAAIDLIEKIDDTRPGWAYRQCANILADTGHPAEADAVRVKLESAKRRGLSGP